MPAVFTQQESHDFPWVAHLQSYSVAIASWSTCAVTLWSVHTSIALCCSTHCTVTPVRLYCGVAVKLNSF